MAPFDGSGCLSVNIQELYLLTMIHVYYIIHRATCWNSGSLLKCYSMCWSGLCLPGFGVCRLSSDISVIFFSPDCLLERGYSVNLDW